jgi:HD-GYP domain-containing protein (c-di-GMP phosphodiesterase class II)
MRTSHEPRATRYVAHMIVATALVVVVPTGASLVLEGRTSRPVSILAGVLLSLALARAGAWMWDRLPGARELEFSEVVVWNWIRLLRAERRLARAARTLGIDEQGNPIHEATISVPERRRLLVQLNSALEAKDPYTLGHTRRVARYSYWIALKMGLDPDEVRAIRFAADVHDVGKINVPDAILRKPARLTDEEFEIMKRHSEVGAEMVAALGDDRITSMIRSHHERWDGNGYPDRLVGEDIPLGARIMAVADTYDAITTSRCYRASSGHEKAVGILRAEAGKQFDADAVEAFLSHRRHRSSRLVALLSTGPWRLVEWAISWFRYGSAAGLAQAGAVVVAASVAATSISPTTFASEKKVRSDRQMSTSSAVEGSAVGPSDDAVATVADSDGGAVSDTTASFGPTRPEGEEGRGDGGSEAPGSGGHPGSGGDPGSAYGPGDGSNGGSNAGNGSDGGGSGPNAPGGSNTGGSESPGGGSGSGLPGLDDVVDGVNDTVDGVVDGVDDTVDEVVDGVNDTVDGVVDGVDDTVDGVVDGVNDTVDGVLDGVNDTVDGLLDGLGGG